MATVTDMGKRNIWIKVFDVLIFSIVTVVYCSGAMPFTIAKATPFTVLPLLVGYSMFSTVTKSAIAGLLCGICVDAVAAKAVSFNAIVLMLIATFVCLFANNFFNKNIKSAVVISLLSSTFYFVLNWALFYTSSTVKDNSAYLMDYALPSAVYTAVLVIPVFYLYRHFDKIK